MKSITTFITTCTAPIKSRRTLRRRRTSRARRKQRRSRRRLYVRTSRVQPVGHGLEFPRARRNGRPANRQRGGDHPSDAQRLADLVTLLQGDLATFGKFRDDVVASTALAVPAQMSQQTPYGQPGYPGQYSPNSAAPQQGYPPYPQQQQPYRLTARRTRRPRCRRAIPGANS